MQTTQLNNSTSVHEPITQPTIGHSDLKLLKVLSLLIDYQAMSCFSVIRLPIAPKLSPNQH